MKTMIITFIIFMLSALVCNPQSFRNDGAGTDAQIPSLLTSCQIVKPVIKDLNHSRGLAILSDKSNEESFQKIERLLSWNQVGNITSEEVSQSSISSDGNRLLVFYSHPNGILDEGKIYEWGVTSWNAIVNPSLECHNPYIVVKDQLVGGAFRTDGYDYGFVSNINGPWVTMTGNYLQHQYGMTIAIAQNRPYLTFACRYSDGMPYPYMMLHIISPFGSGPAATLNGGWRVLYTDVGTDPVITGNESGWYTAFSQGGFLYVMKGYVNTSGQSVFEDIGDGFRVNENPFNPEIVIYSGKPTVVWLENSGLELYVATWNGSAWTLLGGASLSSGSFSSARAASTGSELYISYVTSSGSPRISVNKWNGSQWSLISGILESDSTSTISTAEIAIWKSSPIVCFVENGQVKVLTTAPLSDVESDDISLNEFSLEQNFPNPFNPSTVICYQLPVRSNVTLKVYDILGNEIATLVDEEKPAGNYEVNFHPFSINHHPSSGVYFCRVQVENYSKTIKMLYLK